MGNISIVNMYGDSLLRGTVIDENMRYHATIPQLLEKLGDKFGLLFKNRAHFGSTITRGDGVLQKDLNNGLGCGYALVEFGGNDCSFAWDEVAADPFADHKPFTSLESFKETLTGMVQKLEAEPVTPVLMTLPPLDAERHLQFIGKTEAARKNILQWLGDVQMIYRFHELYSLAVAQVAKQTKAILVDVRQRFLGRHDLRSLVGLDGIHLSEKGYGIMAQAFADFIQARRTQPPRLVYE